MNTMIKLKFYHGVSSNYTLDEVRLKIVIDLDEGFCYIIGARGKEIKTMTHIKRFFNINKSYQFEWNDLRTLITVINVLLIMRYGLSIAWFGLTVAILGMVKELTGNRHINCLVSYIATIILNLYFITLL